jgi:hypothetical protein
VRANLLNILSLDRNMKMLVEQKKCKTAECSY